MKWREESVFNSGSLEYSFGLQACSVSENAATDSKNSDIPSQNSNAFYSPLRK